MRRVVGLGAGGHAGVIIEALRLAGGWHVAALLDSDPGLHGKEVFGVPVRGDVSMLPEIVEEGITAAFIGVGGTADNAPRRRLFDEAIAHGLELVPVLHPSAYIAPSARVGRGCSILARAVINTAASIGDNVIVNTGAIVEHDCTIDDDVHIATGAQLASGVHVGSGAHVGVGASVRQSLVIGDNAIVGVGAAVIEDVPNGATVGGVPARELKHSSEHDPLKGSRALPQSPCE